MNLPVKNTLMKVARLWGMLVILLLTGCGTLHPRKIVSFNDTCRDIKTIGVLQPHIKAGIKYYNTPVYIYSESKSRQLTAALSEQAQMILNKKGYEVTIHQNKMQNPIGWEELRQLILSEMHETAMPFGMPKPLPSQGDVHYLMQMIEAEKVFNRVILNDPGYQTDVLPDDVVYYGPCAELAEYDLVIILYGAMRCETDSEQHFRWFKNVGLNVVTLPLSLASTIMPFTIPFISSTPAFFTGSPDASWLAILAIDPKTGQVVFTNDNFFEGILLESGVRRGIKNLLKPFPKKG